MQNCLKDLIKIKNLCDCSADNADQFYLSNFVNGISYQWLAELSGNSGHKTGMAYSKDLITNAENSLLAQLELVQGNGLILDKIADNFCNACNYAQVMQMSASGIAITRPGQSKNTYMLISKLAIKSNHSGPANVIIDDGENIMFVPVNLTAGAKDIVSINNYKTYKNSILIYMQDQSIMLYKVDCPVSSGCGCSGATSQQPKTFSISGLNVGQDQYGFQPCITTGCDNVNIICNTVTANKALMAKFLAYEIAINVLESMLLNTNLVETKLKLSPELLNAKLSALITEKDMLLFGRKAGHNLSRTLGIVDVMQSFIKIGSDECMRCTGTIQKVTAVM
jgi:hypothetical protein